MAVFHSIEIDCFCGKTFTAEAARSINIRRNPALRVMILDGKFHKIICPTCNNLQTIERQFYYCDPNRSAVFLVLPRGERLNHTRDGQRISNQQRACQLINDGNPPNQVRIVYGLDELREKLVSQDACLDDRHVELLKLLVLHDHPFLLHTPRLQLLLSEVTLTQLKFLAYHHNQPRSYEIQLSRFSVDSFLAQPGNVEQWLEKSGHRAPLLAPERRWVNFRRWSTRYSALDALRNYAIIVASSGAIDLNSPEFKTMCEQLPRAGNLSSASKADLQNLFNYAKQVNDGNAQDKLFEVRYGIALDDEWGSNQDTTDIDTIWNLLRNIPVNNIESNTHLKEIELIGGGGGVYQWSGVIQIGSSELGQQERFEDVLRHEVGHSVHADKGRLVDDWLESEFGWQRFTRHQSLIDAWIGLMGGWEAWGVVSATERVQISNALVQALGNGSSWNPGPRPVFPAGHPWNRPGFGPRLAVERTHSNWYNTFPEWYRANGLAFFLNYWYAELIVVKESTLNLILQMPDRYAAMSHFEFFAEIYSLYYDSDDSGRKAIPTDVANWLDANIGKAGIGMSALPSGARKSIPKKPRKK